VTPVYFKKRSAPTNEIPKSKPKLVNTTSQTEIKKPSSSNTKDTQTIQKPSQLVNTPSQTEVKKPASSKSRDTQTIQKPLQNRDAQTSGKTRADSNQTKDTQTIEALKANETKDTQTIENKTPIETKDTQTEIIEDLSKDLPQDDPKRTNLNGATVKRGDNLPRTSSSRVVSVNKKESKVQQMPTNPFEEIWDVRQLNPDNQDELDEIETEREREQDREKEREKSRLRQLDAQRKRERELELDLNVDSDFEISLAKEEILEEKSKNRAKRAFGGTMKDKRVSSVRPS
jgi:hypothetical protein